jgi:VWFA-related protein
MTRENRKLVMRAGAVSTLATFVFLLASSIPRLQGQSSGASQAQNQQPSNSQTQDIPDAPSTVQPPPPKPSMPANPAPDRAAPEAPESSSSNPNAAPPSKEQQQSPPPMPRVETVPAGSIPRNQINPQEDLYKISVSANFVQIPVTVKYSDGRPVDGLTAKDFTVLENGKKQTLTYFTSDPFQLSVAILLDIGMPDVAVQKVNQTYSALVGALSPYDEAAVYTYSSTVSQVSDFTSRSDKLIAILNQIKLVRGRNNGPPILNGPFSTGPTVNGTPVGGPPGVSPVNTPPREARVLNDAILRAVLDLSKRDRTRRKVIFVISDGRELGSQASYRDVLKLLQSRDVQVKAVVVDSGALPLFKQVEKIRLKGQGYSNILPRYSSATGGGQVFSEISRNSIEDAYAQIASEARNQYTLGYPTKAGASNAYRSIEVQVDKKDLKISAKDGYYPAPPVH